MIVILSNQDRYFLGWARQFVAHDTAQRGLVVLDNITPGAQAAARRNVDRHYEPAAQLAGTGGTLVISVGHGGTAHEECDGVSCPMPSDTSVGMIDLLPGGALRIQREHVFYYHDLQASDRRIVARAEEIGTRQCQTYSRRYRLSDERRQPPAELASDVAACSGASYSRERLEIRAAYDRIGEILRRHRVAGVVLLTCKVGNSTEFLDHIAADWRISITGYTRRVASIQDREQQFRVYLHPDHEGHGTNTERARHELPAQDRYNARAPASETVAGH